MNSSKSSQPSTSGQMARCAICNIQFRMDTSNLMMCVACTSACAASASEYIEQNRTNNNESASNNSIHQHLHVLGCETLLARAESAATAENASAVARMIDEIPRRRITCPLRHVRLERYSCIWSGKPTDLYDHIEETHPRFLCQRTPEAAQDADSMILDLKKVMYESKRVFFGLMQSQLVTVFVRHAENAYYVLVLLNGSYEENAKYRCEVNVFDSRQQNTICFNKRHLPSLDNFAELLSDKNPMLKLDFSKLSQSLPRLKKVPLVTLRIMERVDLDTDELMLDFDGRSLNYEVIQHFECMACNRRMFPPIYLCSSGHSICACCEFNKTSCPVCHQAMSDRRNLTLEKMSTCMNFPCSYRPLGCFLVANADDMEKHEPVCEFMPKQCIFTNCNWTGRKFEFLEHIQCYH